ncbi:hypothetical protein PUNSTDRAFT_137604 [Punctularia strigosozonata HHB-11173 SS5]|uniref:uncharacterized protein n=1 Tax=Punctularia strigosozonata (strain HHB-11173) TaxID=741275 RepID=UPI0004418694|nr:uncharacterized protein PUNSTDRAFT_137604 [Punctularia strigosozonata HHB-11173 SS5]EIN05493.1 hypothetical protein PUNSTDRAFT_137604 [Punctularia strigosozonata HHB-11173 SS5]
MIDNPTREPTTLEETSPLSYPALGEPGPSTVVALQPPQRPLLKDRIYVGNLHPSVDEYCLIQVFSKFGKISKLDFLFHKSGPLKGKPRGYAFVQYASTEDAAKALERANDKMLRGRKITVTYAQQASLDDVSGYGYSSGVGGNKYRKGMMDMNKPTTLSLLKGAESGKKQGMSNKIAKMEAKLRELQASSSPSSSTPPPPSMTPHPSLPSKPTFDPDAYSTLSVAFQSSVPASVPPLTPAVGRSSTGTPSTSAAQQGTVKATSGLGTMAPHNLKALPSIQYIQNLANNVKVYRRQCQYLSRRCGNLLTSLNDNLAGMEGSRAQEAADGAMIVIERVKRRTAEWASWNLMNSVVKQNRIKQGIDDCQREIDHCLEQFSLEVSLISVESQHRLREERRRDQNELLENLQTILQNTQHLDHIVRDPNDTESIMRTIQEGLDSRNLERLDESRLQQALHMLHEKTSRLPPLADLTSQIQKTSTQVVDYGAFNDVYTGLWLGQEKVALKLPKVLDRSSNSAQRKFLREVEIWRNLSHPNILRFYGIFREGDCLYSVSPWTDDGNASAYICRHPKVDRLKLLRDVVRGMEYLHLQNIVHGDLRGANVLILVTADGPTAVLSDFGLSKIVAEVGQRLNASSAPGLTNYRWLAPELMLRRHGHAEIYLTTSTDVYSFAMTCLELIVGHMPFLNLTDPEVVIRVAVEHERPERPQDVQLPDEMWQLIQDCWDDNPEFRPDMTTIRERIRGIHDRFIADRHVAQTADLTRHLELPSSHDRAQEISGTSSTSGTIVDLDPSSPLPKITSPGEIRLTPDGRGVERGTLNALVAKLVYDHRDEAYSRIFLTMYPSFTTSAKLFNILQGHFRGAGDQTSLPMEMVHQGVTNVLYRWINSYYVDSDADLLPQIQEFAYEMRAASASEQVMEELISSIHKRITIMQQVRLSHLKPLSGARPPTSDLAIALTVLEGHRFARLTPGACIAYLQRIRGREPVDEALDTHHRIHVWCQQEILMHTVDDCPRVYAEFVKTADDCLKLGNFSAMMAIGRALDSAAVMAVPGIRDQIFKKNRYKAQRPFLQQLLGLIDPKGEHAAYHDSVRSAKYCIPWLEMHLQRVSIGAPSLPPVELDDAGSLIEFAALQERADQVLEILSYKPVDLSQVRDKIEDILAFVEDHLQATPSDPSHIEHLSREARGPPRRPSIVDRIRESFDAPPGAEKRLPPS